MKKDPGFVSVYNKIAHHYDRRHGNSCKTAHDLVLKNILATKLNPQCILDIGCGTGQLLIKLKKEWPNSHVNGVDPAEKMLLEASKRDVKLDLFLADVEKLPFSDNSIDLVVSTVSFSHWKDKLKGLNEICRVMKPGGEVVIVEHDKPNIFIKLLLRLMNRLPELISLSESQRIISKVTELSAINVSVKDGYQLLHLRKGYST